MTVQCKVVDASRYIPGTDLSDIPYVTVANSDECGMVDIQIGQVSAKVNAQQLISAVQKCNLSYSERNYT